MSVIALSRNGLERRVSQWELLAAGLWLLAAGLVVFGTWYLVFPHSVSKEIPGSAIQASTDYQIPNTSSRRGWQPAASIQHPAARSQKPAMIFSSYSACFLHNSISGFPKWEWNVCN